MKRKPIKRAANLPASLVRPNLSRQSISTLGEHALMGQCVPVSVDWVDDITHYILGVLSASYMDSPINFPKISKGFSILNRRIRRTDPNRQVTHIYTCQVYGMPCIGYVLKGRDIPDPFTEDYGSGYPCATCYVFNVLNDFCSEMGDCFFEMREDGCYHRVS